MIFYFTQIWEDGDFSNFFSSFDTPDTPNSLSAEMRIERDVSNFSKDAKSKKQYDNEMGQIHFTKSKKKKSLKV